LLAVILLPLALFACSDDDDDGPDPTPAQPDLVVSSITFDPAVPDIQDPVTVTVIVRNAGNGAANPSELRLRVDGDEACTIDVAGLGPSASDTVSCELLPLEAAADYEVIACADADSTIAESIETNNCRTDNLTVTAPGPNLVVESILFTPASPTEDETVTVTVTVRNEGGVAAEASFVRIDRVGGVGEVYCDSIPTPALPSGGAESVVCEFGPLPAGEYNIRACADALTDVIETNEDDNCRSQTLTVAAGAPRADLRIRRIAFAPTAPGPESVITATIVVENTGGADAAATLTDILVDGTLTCDDVATNAIAAGDSVEVTCEFGPLASGNHAVEAWADAGGTVEETDEEDNDHSVTVFVSGGAPRADLQIRRIYFTPADPGPQDEITATIVVENAGDADAAASASDFLIDGAMACEGVATAEVAAGDSLEVTCDFGALGAGTYTIEGRVDVAGAVEESDEDDNAWTTDLVVTGETPQADLQIRRIYFTPAAPVAGETVTAYIVIENDNLAAAAATVTDILVDDAPACDDVATGGVAGGDSVVVSCDLGGLAAGFYTIEACADAGSAVDESDETDNCLAGLLVVTEEGGGMPDIPGLPTGTTVDFCNDDPMAQQAEFLVTSQLSMVGLFASIGQGLIDSLDTLDWTDIGGGCREATEVEEGCTSRIELCDAGDGYDLRVFLTGPCVPGEDGEPDTVVTNWQAIGGHLSADGTSGSISSHYTNTTTPRFSWTWSTSPDGRQGTWNSYAGAPGTGELFMTLTYEVQTGGSVEMSLEIPAQLRWDVTVSADGRTGVYEMFLFEDPAFWRETRIEWADCSGTWITYDSEGEILDQQSW